MKKCPSCGYIGETWYCPKCQTTMQAIKESELRNVQQENSSKNESIKCPNCGMVTNDSYCPRCQTALKPKDDFVGESSNTGNSGENASYIRKDTNAKKKCPKCGFTSEDKSYCPRCMTPMQEISLKDGKKEKREQIKKSVSNHYSKEKRKEIIFVSIMYFVIGAAMWGAFLLCGIPTFLALMIAGAITVVGYILASMEDKEILKTDLSAKYLFAMVGIVVLFGLMGCCSGGCSSIHHEEEEGPPDYYYDDNGNGTNYDEWEQDMEWEEDVEDWIDTLPE